MLVGQLTVSGMSHCASWFLVLSCVRKKTCPLLTGTYFFRFSGLLCFAVHQTICCLLQEKISQWKNRWKWKVGHVLALVCCICFHCVSFESRNVLLCFRTWRRGSAIQGRVTDGFKSTVSNLLACVFSGLSMAMRPGLDTKKRPCLLQVFTCNLVFDISKITMFSAFNFLWNLRLKNAAISCSFFGCVPADPEWCQC